MTADSEKDAILYVASGAAGGAFSTETIEIDDEPVVCVEKVQGE